MIPISSSDIRRVYLQEMLGSQRAHRVVQKQLPDKTAAIFRKLAEKWQRETVSLETQLSNVLHRPAA